MLVRRYCLSLRPHCLITCYGHLSRPIGRDGHAIIGIDGHPINVLCSLLNFDGIVIFLQMPNKYIRKTDRGSWKEEDLRNAINKVNNDGYSVRKASMEFNIPRKTLERKLKTGCDSKIPMGPSSSLGSANELRLVRHIKEMQTHGFPLTRDCVRRLAYDFAMQLGLKHKFNNEKGKAGYDWLQLFLSRHPDLSVRKSEGVSLARIQGMNRDEIKEYFNLLSTLMEENDLVNKPGSIFNMDESGLQLNSRPGIVVAEKGSKTVPVVTSSEKGETITVLACCNAEGMFLPPFVVMKGVNKKKEWEDNMPPGSKVVMSKKSAYVNAEIFFEWLSDHFLPRKPLGTVMLILDGHTSHSSSVQMLEFCEMNGIILVCLPSHTTHYLQPLDRSVFKSLKHHFYSAVEKWQRNHPDRKVGRLQFGDLLQDCWGKAATPANAVSGFKATGIYPFNPDAIPDYAFRSDSDRLRPTETENMNVSGQTLQDSRPTSSPLPHSATRATSPLPGPSTRPGDIWPVISNEANQVTPTKILNNISPLPVKPKTQTNKRRKIKATNLTSKENIKKLKLKLDEKGKRPMPRPRAIRKKKRERLKNLLTVQTLQMKSSTKKTLVTDFMKKRKSALDAGKGTRKQIKSVIGLSVSGVSGGYTNPAQRMWMCAIDVAMPFYKTKCKLIK